MSDPFYFTEEEIKTFGGGSGGSINKLRKQNPLPQIDKRIVFYDYVVIDENGKPQPEIEIDVRGKIVDKSYCLPPNWKIANHKYFVDGVQMRESLTSFIKRFHDEFDEEAHSNRLANEAKFGSIYYEKSAEQIKQMWEDNRVNGTLMHEYLELFYNDAHDPTDERRNNPSFLHFVQFQREFVIANDLVPFRTELRNFDQTGCATHDELCGTADMLYMRRADIGDIERGCNVIVIDWKFLNKMYTTGFKENGVTKMCIAPFDALPDVNLYHYYIQLNGYRYLLERRTPLIVTDMYVADFGANNARYQLYQVPDLQAKFYTAVSVRKEQLLEGYIVKMKRTFDETKEELSRANKKIKVLEESFVSATPLIEELMKQRRTANRQNFADKSQTLIKEFFAPKK